MGLIYFKKRCIHFVMYQIICVALGKADVAQFENKLHIHGRHGLRFNRTLYTTSNLLPKRKNVLFDVEKYL